MADMISTDNEEGLRGALADLDRRRMLRRASFGAGIAALAASGILGSTNSANAANQGVGPADVDILNFALNLEYLEAEFYMFATTGQGLPANMRTGTGTQGPVGLGLQVPFRNATVAQFAARIAVDETNHVAFLRTALGGLAVAEPYIDVGVSPTSSFSTAAVAAGLIVQGQTFNPYADDISFLIGASIFEDVGVTAYAGAARFIGNPTYLEAAAGILAIEAYHSGAVRTLLSMLGGSVAFGAISNLRGTLSAATGGGSGEQPILLSPTESYNFAPSDGNSLAFRRSTRQVLNIVYGAAGASKGLFFPNGLNGNITT